LEGQEEYLSPQNCSARINFVEEYSRCITAYSALRDALEGQPEREGQGDWRSVEAAWAKSQKAWEALAHHIAEHQCLNLGWPRRFVAHAGASDILGEAAAAALDMILVADDDRRLVDVNEVAADILGLPRYEIVGRRIDEFFSEARGEAIPVAWNNFVSEGVQSGICELKASGEPRRFEYRAKANFAAGLHLSVLREQT
jgi:PAS domain-containing protein